MRILIWFKLYHIYDKVKRVMINTDNILDISSDVGLWCRADADPTDLAQAASIAIEKNISVISVGVTSVPIVWPWLEKQKIKIFSRFYMNGHSIENVSQIAEKINSAFKQGADGAQVFMRLSDLREFVSQLYLIRDDLFFNKSIFIGLDINEIETSDWDFVFSELKKMRATGLLLVMPHDDGEKSDFVGRVYAALSAYNNEIQNIGFHFYLGDNQIRIEQTFRLIQALQENLLKDVKFFINI